jgi:hypothetical protein
MSAASLRSLLLAQAIALLKVDSGQAKPVSRNPGWKSPVATVAQPTPGLAGAVIVILMQATGLRDRAAKLTARPIFRYMLGAFAVTALPTLPFGFLRAHTASKRSRAAASSS